MKEYHVLVSVHNDLNTPAVLTKHHAKERGQSTSIYTIRCNSIEEIPDLFLDVCGDECYGMKSRMYWYVDAGYGWILTDL